MNIASKLAALFLSSTALGFAGELIPIGALEEFIVTPAPARFANVLQQQDGSYVAYTEGYGAKVYWSADGETWTLQQTLVNTGISAMATGGRKTLLVGWGGAASVSSDGKTWAAVNAPTFYQLAAVAYQGDAFYALSANSELWRWAAQDGWSKISPLPGEAKFLVTGLGKWFAWSGGFGANANALYVSADGVTWTTQTFSERVTDVDVGDGSVMVSTGSITSTSVDGVTWGPNRYWGSYTPVTFASGRYFRLGIGATGDVPDVVHKLKSTNFQPRFAAACDCGLIVLTESTGTSAGMIAISRPAQTAPVVQGGHLSAPPVDWRVNLGSSLPLTIYASGGGLNYQWYEGDVGDTRTPIPEAESFSRVVTVYRDMKLWCRISNKLGQLDVGCTLTAFISAYGSLVYELTPRTQDETVTIAEMYLQVEPQSVRWTRNGVGVPAGKSPQLIRVGPTFDDAGYYKANVFYEGRTYTSDPVTVGVVRRTVTIGGLTGEGKSVRLRQMAAGPELTYQWTREGQWLEDAPGHIEGATNASLTITNIRPEDEGWYVCLVSNGVYTLEGMSYYLTVEPIPVIESIEAPAEGMVARSMRIQPQSRQVVLRYEVRGLPAGMTFDSKSGTIAGAPLASGTHRIGIRAINSAGASPWQTITITVAPMPDHLTGSFAGLMGRMVTTGEGLGGACSIKVSKTGAVTGFVDIGSKRYPYTGRLDCTGSTPTCFTTKCAGGQVVVQFSYQALSDSMVGSAGALDGSWSTPLLAKKVGLSSQSAAWVGKRYVDLTPLTVSADRPQGSGTGTISIGRLGNFSWVGKLADGSAYSSAGHLTPDGQFAARTLLYGGKGSLQGWQQVDATKDKPYGTLEWMKNPVPNAKSFPQGFARHSLSVTPKP